jgi:hypothetical protein
VGDMAQHGRGHHRRGEDSEQGSQSNAGRVHAV